MFMCNLMTVLSSLSWAEDDQDETADAEIKEEPADAVEDFHDETSTSNSTKQFTELQSPRLSTRGEHHKRSCTICNFNTPYPET